MRNGRGDRVEPIRFTEEDRVDFIDSFLKDERAADEWKTAVKHLEYIINNGDDECSYEAEEILLNIEAIMAYESGVFNGKDYWAETYWDNYKRGFANARKAV